jgi:hypothetical protein
MITSKSTGEFEVKKDGKRGKLENVFPVLLTVAGAIFVLIGLGGYVALTYAPAGRWLADKVPSMAEDLEPPGSADLQDKPLKQIVDQAIAGKYCIRLSEGAGAIKITGTYRDFKCDADLIYRICQDSNESDKLTCVHDSTTNILRVCAKAEGSICLNHAL